MSGDPSRNDLLLLDGLGDQPFRQCRQFAVRHHPANDVAAEDVDDDVEVVICPLCRLQQLRDVPAPQLVRLGGEQLGLA